MRALYNYAMVESASASINCKYAFLFIYFVLFQSTKSIAVLKMVMFLYELAVLLVTRPVTLTNFAELLIDRNCCDK